jgi:hypothetical protein
MTWTIRCQLHFVYAPTRALHNSISLRAFICKLLCVLDMILNFCGYCMNWSICQAVHPMNVELAPKHFWDSLSPSSGVGVMNDSATHIYTHGMLSELSVSTGNRTLDPKSILWIEIWGAAISLIVSTRDDEGRVPKMFDMNYKFTLPIIFRTLFLRVYKPVTPSLQQHVNYIGFMPHIEWTMEFLCFELLQVYSLFDLIIGLIIEN